MHSMDGDANLGGLGTLVATWGSEKLRHDRICLKIIRVCG